MSAGTSFGTLLLALVCLPLIVLGGILFKRAVWPRRRGTEPYCGKCGYLLIGLLSQRCPECGVELSPSNIVHGRRDRRMGLAILGLVMLLIGLAGPAMILSHQIGNIQWYHLKPAFLVMRDLRPGTGAVADNAMRELDRRDAAGDLSSGNQQIVIAMALAQQATASQSSLAEDSVLFLERRYAAGQLTDAQKALFEQQCIQLSLTIRPAVVVAHDVPFWIDEKCRVVGARVYVHLEDADKIEIDGVTVRRGTGGSGSMNGLGAGGGFGNSVKAPPPGKHTLRVSNHVELLSGYFSSSAPPLYQGEAVVSGTFEVVAEGPPGELIVNNDPALAGPIHASITPARFSIGKADPGSLQGELRVTSVPTSIAFDVFVRCNGQTTRAAGIAMKKGSSTTYAISARLADGPQPSSVDVILRSNAEVARNTVDMHDLWSGELTFPNVPVTVDPSR
jgi:hypothetical protein